MSLNDARTKKMRSDYKKENFSYGSTLLQNDKNSEKINPTHQKLNRDTLQLESVNSIDHNDNDNPFPLEVSMSNIHNNSFNENNPFKRKKADLIVDIDLGEGQIEKLIFKFEEDPQLAAYRFCQIHDLDEKVIPMLVESIMKYMGDIHKQQELESRNTSFSSTKDRHHQVIDEQESNKKLTGHFAEEDRPDFLELVNNAKISSNQNSQNKLDYDKKNQNELSIQEDKEKPAFYVTVNISDNEKYDIPVFERDNPMQIATLFCRQNDIDDSAIKYVADVVNHQLIQYQTKRLQPIYPSKQCSVKSFRVEEEEEEEEEKEKEKELNKTVPTVSQWNILSNIAKIEENVPQITDNKYASLKISNGNHQLPSTNHSNINNQPESSDKKDNKQKSSQKVKEDPQKKYEQWTTLIKQNTEPTLKKGNINSFIIYNPRL